MGDRQRGRHGPRGGRVVATDEASAEEHADHGRSEDQLADRRNHDTPSDDGATTGFADNAPRVRQESLGANCGLAARRGAAPFVADENSIEGSAMKRLAYHALPLASGCQPASSRVTSSVSTAAVSASTEAGSLGGQSSGGERATMTSAALSSARAIAEKHAPSSVSLHSIAAIQVQRRSGGDASTGLRCSLRAPIVLAAISDPI